MNNIVLIGRLVNDPELKYVGEPNNPVTNFRIAVSRNYKTKDGIVESDFINIEIWGKKAETCGQYLQKGRLIAVDGCLRIDKYQTTEGDNKSITKVRANDIKFLDNTNKKQNNKNYYDASKVFEESSTSNTELEISDDEVPF
ncbi:MAG: single-stranded DNA-binding protein [Peptostreptococcaceae bacterium]|nr:single-stranded DNA-binding protein [Peptostreptococcaceae bacterium]MDU4936118.1 single-stranded DNA-binding protein [Peptostreptococcaceae bacterium]